MLWQQVVLTETLPVICEGPFLLPVADAWQQLPIQKKLGSSAESVGKLIAKGAFPALSNIE
jgi:hypothetical protein